MNVPVRYRICPRSPEAHLFEVTVTVKCPAKRGQIFRLPTWTPGSYMIREFSRHIVTLVAETDDGSVSVTKLDKHTWQIEPVRKPLTIRYCVYAFDLSVRAAYLDTQWSFFNGASVFLMVDGYEATSCGVEIVPPFGTPYAHWQVATGLSAVSVQKASGFGYYIANNYDELIDNPFGLGCFERINFEACGIPHQLVIAGRFHADLQRMKSDIKKLCETHIALFAGSAPFEHYLFILFVGDRDLYGGLEHRSSTLLLSSRDDLPVIGESAVSDGYLRLLGLISHEYFHSWNVKSIKPAAFVPYNLTCENYTRLLWAFEGVTSYYDDLMLARSGLIDGKRYLSLLAKTITNVMRNHGRTKQTLEEASFDAWIKYYRQDENSPNSLVSYYTKGSLVALALDLLIRRETHNTKSLDDVMRALWHKFLADSQGLAEDEWERIASDVTGVVLTSFFNCALRSTQDLPLAELFISQGIEMRLDLAESSHDRGSACDLDACSTLTQPHARVSLGVRTVTEAAGIRLTHVLDGGAAQKAGLSGGDMIVAIDGLKAVDVEKQLMRFAVGDTVRIHAFRRDELMTVDVILIEEEANTCRLCLRPVESSWFLPRINN